MIADKMAIPRPAVKRTGSEMDQEPCLSVGLEALASGGAVILPIVMAACDIADGVTGRLDAWPRPLARSHSMLLSRRLRADGGRDFRPVGGDLRFASLLCFRS